MEKVKKISNSEYEIEITLKEKEVKPYIDKALNNAIKKVKEPGFRAGKMPKNMFIKKYGMESVYPTAVDDIINTLYPKVVEENKLQVIAQPDFDWTSLKITDQEFYVKGKVEVMPEIELPDIETIKAKITKKEAKVTKKEIKEAIENLLAKDATYEVSEDKETKNGDIVVLDFEGSVDGKTFEGGSAEDYSLTIGSNSFIPGFEEQLVGKKYGEEVDVNVTFPENYPAEELSGEEAIFKCKLKEVKKRTLPKLTAKKIESLENFDVKTKEELEEKIEEDVKLRKESSLQMEYEKKVLDAIIKTGKIQIPAALIEGETNQTLNNLENNFKQQGFGLDMYLQMTGMDIETLKKQLNLESEVRVAKQLIIDSYVKNNKIKVTKKEIDEEMQLLSEQYKITEEEIIKSIGEEKEPLIKDIEFKKANEIIFS